MFIELIVILLLSVVSGTLRTSEHLTKHCYHFPAKDFGKGNSVKDTYGKSPKVIISAGSTAIDFTLPTITGELVTLSDILSKKAVLLIWGHYTCPAFQGLNSDTMFIGSSYVNEKEFIDSVGDKVQVIHLIGPEPHPLWPHTNFDSGSMKMNLWSTITQPQSYDERIKESASRVLPLLHDDTILLIDYLDGVGGEYNNPVWCSYANGARSAVLIAQDGIIIATQDWFSKDDLIIIVNENL